MIKILILTTFLIQIISCTTNKSQDSQSLALIQTAAKKLGIKENLSLMNKDLYDNDEQKLIEDYEYKFLVKADLNKNKISETFLAAKGEGDKSYLFVFEGDKSPKLLKHFVFEEYRFSLSFHIIDIDTVRVLFNLEGGEYSTGGVIWEDNHFLFEQLIIKP